VFREALSQFNDIHLTIIAFFLFLVTFIGIVLWTFRSSQREHYERMARLPLDERNHHE